MAYAVDEGDDDGDDDDSVDEDPLLSDQDPDGADEAGETIPCPFCAKPVHEDADVCRRCGNYIGGVDAPRPHLPLFLWIGVILAALCVLTWVLL